MSKGMKGRELTNGHLTTAARLPLLAASSFAS